MLTNYQRIPTHLQPFRALLPLVLCQGHPEQFLIPPYSLQLHLQEDYQKNRLLRPSLLDHLA
jgi:hypothetical protein